MKKRTIALLMALVLVIGAAVGGTVAWLTAETDPVVNTFTVGDINIDLTESEELDLRIIPGNEIKKDPKVTVMPDSEACWLFVKVEEANWPDFKESDTAATRKVDYAIEGGWTALDGETGVYYCEVSTGEAKSGKSFYVLAGSEKNPNGVVTVSENLTKAEMNSIGTGDTAPTLTFTAYAVQKENIADALTAWSKVNPSA